MTHRDIIAVNPGDQDWAQSRYILAFGAYGDTLLMAWANSLDDALDECIDWIADNAPGLLCDDAVAEEYQARLAEGMSEEEAQEAAELDTTCGGNYGHYILSWEWGIVAENPTRDEILTIQGRKEHE